MSTETIEDLLGEILLDCYGEDEELWGFLSAFSEEVPVPAEASIIGQRVEVLEFDYDGNPLRGLTASCRAGDGRVHNVSVADLSFPTTSPGALYHAAYRSWLGP
ncbi:hypothetical protein DYH09_05290 [bacterium CPR1]|nr:hypothetical protein [bacterium CPR1]